MTDNCSRWTWTAEEWKQYRENARKIAAKHMWTVSKPWLALIKKAEGNSRKASQEAPQ